MLEYQNQTVETFLKLLPFEAKVILEIGSDIGGEVVSDLTRQTGARVVGCNFSHEFPQLTEEKLPNASFLRSDGRYLPFQDNSFDAVMSVATMEHVNGLGPFLHEVARVLRPKGLFYTDFSPIWSSARGHHVYAVAGPKEARFWKPGKNPIPDFWHLLLTPDEMREYLHSGPCSEELIEPVIQWIYFGDNINRCGFEEYMEVFRKCPLVIQDMSFSYERPDNETRERLHQKYGQDCEFDCTAIRAVFRKPPRGAGDITEILNSEKVAMLARKDVLLSQKDEQIHAIYETLSWKITAPLRWLGKRLLGRK